MNDKNMKTVYMGNVKAQIVNWR